MVTSAGIGLPGHRSPGVGFEAPFEMLCACHERVTSMLDLLSRLRLHLIQKGWDEPASRAAADVMRYFDLAAPEHHLDEELHVFPAVLALQNGHMDAVINRLQQEHIEMEKRWAGARKALLRVIDSDQHRWTLFQASENAILDSFFAVYQDHILDEESVIYPAAMQALTSDQLQRMSLDMMRRRGQVPPA
jgi:hemerythrin-like domain-containing protein